ncbi:lectin ADEL-like [Aplysia californica]|uniref:Lectin ADEL-like n=1 Tax=Aplysia californica TaxID=6500 RepID=A0ABM1A390_APLCA|nr:lectin ADEL-like [Aplysia californica]
MNAAVVLVFFSVMAATQASLLKGALILYCFNHSELNVNFRLLFSFFFFFYSLGRPTECQVLRVESWKYKSAEKNVEGAALFIDMTVEDRQSEASCDLDKSFGFYNQNSTVWVDHGCRADFNICYVKGTTSTTRVNLSSWKYKYATKILPSATYIYSMQVAKQQSVAPCTLGTTYGFVANTMWVSDGCRANFSIRHYSH